jgi:hypothetical protein
MASPAEEFSLLQKSSRSLLSNICQPSSPSDATLQQAETQCQTAAGGTQDKAWQERKRLEDLNTVPYNSSASLEFRAVVQGVKDPVQFWDREAVCYTPVASPKIQSTAVPVSVPCNNSSSGTPSSSHQPNETLNSEELSHEVPNWHLKSVDTSHNRTNIDGEWSDEPTASSLPSAHLQPSLNPYPPTFPPFSTCDLPLDLDNFPIKIMMGSIESKKYELRSIDDKVGLYYSCAVWPEELPRRNRSFVFGRLRTDLNNYIMKACKEKKKKREMRKNRIALTEQAFTLELRLSGRVVTNKQDIELRPTIWAICASRFYKTLVEEALAQCQLSWIADEPIEIVLGLTFNKQRERVSGLDLSKGFHFAQSYRVHLHIEEPGEESSACGLVTCATITKDRDIVDQCISRLGGLIQLNDETVCASSTAHGVLDMLIAAGLDLSEEDGPFSAGEISSSDVESDEELDNTVATDLGGDSQSAIRATSMDGMDLELANPPTTGNITRWHTVPKAVIFDFVRAALPNPDNQGWTLGTDVRAHDFTLFELWPDLLKKLHNSYSDKLTLHRVTEYRKGCYFSPGKNEIMVLLGHDTSVPGKILPGKSTIYMAGVCIPIVFLLPTPIISRENCSRSE